MSGDAAEALEHAVVPLVRGGDAEVDQPARDDGQREHPGQQEDDRLGRRRRDAEPHEEHQHGDRDDEHRKQVLGTTRGQAQLDAESCRDARQAAGRRAHGASRRSSRAKYASSRVPPPARSSTIITPASAAPAASAATAAGVTAGPPSTRYRPGPPSASELRLREPLHGAKPSLDRLGLGGIERPANPEPDRRSDPGGEFGGRPGCDHATAVDHHDPVCQPFDVGEVVAREQDRRPAGSRLRDDLADDDARLGVEAGRRLVEQQDLGPADERHCKRQPLPLAAGQAAVRGARHGREPEQREQLVGIPRILVIAGELDQRLARS